MADHADRRLAVLDRLPDDVDALLVTNLVNLRYLCGFTGSNGALLLARDGRAWLATDGRYVTQAETEAPGVPLVESRTVAATLVERTIEEGLGRLGVEREQVTLGQFARLSEAAESSVELSGVEPVVEQIRIVKDTDELARLTRACALTDAAFGAVVSELRPGVTERAVARRLEEQLLDRGADGLAFPSIVAAGPHGAMPHHRPSDRPLQRGDLVVIDFGGRYDGYHADMTRTVVIGRAADWQREIYALVREVQEQGRDQVRPGALPKELNQAAEQAIVDAGHECRHPLGHGVGLEIHESPYLSKESSADRLVANVPVTVEPGVYLPGRGGVRIEDTVVVGAHGVETPGAESLTRSSRDLIEI